MSESSLNTRSALCLGRCAVTEPMEPKHLLFNTIQLRRKSEPLGTKKSLKRVLKSPTRPGQLSIYQRKWGGLPVFLTYFAHPLSPSCNAVFPSQRRKTKQKVMQNLVMEPMPTERKKKKNCLFTSMAWHGTSKGSGTKDDLQSLCS